MVRRNKLSQKVDPVAEAEARVESLRGERAAVTEQLAERRGRIGDLVADGATEAVAELREQTRVLDVRVDELDQGIAVAERRVVEAREQVHEAEIAEALAGLEKSIDGRAEVVAAWKTELAAMEAACARLAEAPAYSSLRRDDLLIAARDYVRAYAPNLAALLAVVGSSGSTDAGNAGRLDRLEERAAVRAREAVAAGNLDAGRARVVSFGVRRQRLDVAALLQEAGQ